MYLLINSLKSSSRSLSYLKSNCAGIVTIWFFVLLTPFIFSSVRSQIVDIDNAVIYEDPQWNPLRSTYFGYTLLLYSKNGTSWIVIGAPRANSSILKNVHEPGEVYRCGFKEVCSPIFLDNKASRELKNNHDKRILTNEMKDGSWLGGSMAIHPTSDKLAVCAPRRYMDNNNMKDRIMQGSCYATNLNRENVDNTLAIQLAPLFNTSQLVTKVGVQKPVSVFYYALGEVGLSAYFSAIKETNGLSDLILGAPGVLNSKGTTVLLSSQNAQGNSHTSDPIVNRKDFGKVVIPTLRYNNEFLDGDYFGYSGTSGYFYSQSQLYHVASAPRSNKHTGKIAIYRFPRETEDVPNIKQYLFGDKPGCYFGASLAAADFNGDGFDDLLVGAPYGTIPKVHIYLGNERDLLAPKESGTTVLQMSQWGRLSQFGISLATADFNHDGFVDVVVGAPEANGIGAIAIFMGKSSGLEVSPRQVIYATDVYTEIKLYGFGMSLAQPVDIDENQYPDVAVGAYKSAHVAILRSIPEARLKARLESKEGLVNDIIKVKACLEYYWDLDYYARQNITVQRTVIADSAFDSPRGRATLVGAAGQGNRYKLVKTITAMVPWCEVLEFKLENSINYLIPLEITLHGVKKEVIRGKQPIIVARDSASGQDRFDKLDPKIIDLEEGTHVISIPLQTNCGDDGNCTADLKVHAIFPNYTNSDFIVGSVDTVIMEITVENTKESAYSTEIRVTLPHEASLARLPPICRTDVDIIACKVDNPLLNGHSKTIHLEVDMRVISESTLKREAKKFIVEAVTQSSELQPEDNIAEAVLQLALDSRVVVAGKSQKDTYSYAGSGDNNTYELVEFKHMYEVQKFGASNVEEVLLEVQVPYKYYKRGDEIEFLQIYEPDGFQNGQPFTCERTDYIYAQQKTEDNEGNDDTTLGLTAAAKMKRSVLENEYFKPIREFDPVYEKYRSSLMKTRTKREMKEEILENLPANRTVFLSCDIPNVLCHTISCRIGPFRRTQHVARLHVTMLMNITTLKINVMGVKDIIAVTTRGTATIVKGEGGGGSAEVRSVFVSSPPELVVEMWIIILSVIIGLLVVLFFTMGLVKAGFFKRKAKEDLAKLKEAEASKKNESNELMEEDLKHDPEDFSIEQM